MNDLLEENNCKSQTEYPVAKRHKTCENLDTNTRNTLATICDWNRLSDIAIKHCEVSENSIEISYAELAKIQLDVTEFLRDTKNSQFIGIADDVPSYCLPGLMLGIASNGQAFVCLPPSSAEALRIRVSLNIMYIFSSKIIDVTKKIKKFEIHGTQLYLLQATNLESNLMKFAVSDEFNGYFAYAITTSGSTGKPKIVRVTHSSIVPNILDLKRILSLSNEDTIAQITPVTFDPSIIEIFLSLSCNGTLLTVSNSLKNNPEMLLKKLVKHRVTVIQSTPSLLLHRWSSEELKKSILGENSNLRILILGGETIPSVDILSRCKAPENKTKIFDIYGITEVSCWASLLEIELTDFKQNLGKNLSDTILEVRDESGKIVREGGGILYIGSQSRICLIDEEDIKNLSTPIFRNTGDIVEIDKKGCITLKGRRERKVKRYGAKVYLSDLESHVQNLSFVKNCYALFNERNQSLHLFFTTFNEKFIDADKKLTYEKAVLHQTKELSSVYHPDKVCHLNRFELTSHGKICRNYLKKYSAKLLREAQTGSNAEKFAVEIFTKLWKNSELAEDDLGFIDSGGSSIMAMRIVNELSDRINLDFPELIGQMLMNKNLHTCLKYVGEHSSNFSKTINLTKAKDFFISDNSKLNAVVQSEEEKQAEHSSNNPKSSSSILAWQMCKGKSSFNFPQRKKNEDVWNNVSKIHLKHLYHLGKCVDASPTVFGYSEAESYVTVGSHSGVVCTAELNKKKSPDHWQITLPDRIESSILVLDDFRGIVGTYDGNLYCIHLKTGELFWKFKTDEAVKCTAVLCSRRQNVFFGSYDRHIYCLSIEKGSEIWKQKVGNGSISATPCVDAELDAVFFALLDGTCVSLKQTTGEINWKQTLDYPVFSGPAILKIGVVIFCDVTGKLSSFSASTGDKTWTMETNGGVFSHLVVHTDQTTNLQSIIFASQNRCIYKIECRFAVEKPILQLQKDLGIPVVSTPWSNGRVTVVVGIKGDLKLLDFTTGEELATFKLGGDVYSSPIIHGNFITVGCRDDNLYVLSVDDPL